MALPPPLLTWPLLSLPNGAGQLGYPSLETSVRQRIEVILRTRPGEQLMRPDFGGSLEEFLNQPNTLTTQRRIHDRINDALTRWESRIVLDRVEVNEVPGQPSHLRVEIWYRIKRTNTAQQLGLTLQLEA
jgi:phage baseplate assembly protein W